ncbi:MAG: hypothetical protein Q9222_006438 [Ikaeria aurantiellina]
MGSLRFSEYAESPALVVPPPSVHSFYPSAWSHSVPHFQQPKPVLNPDPVTLPFGNANTGKLLTPSHPAQKRAREESPNYRDAMKRKVSKRSFDSGLSDGSSAASQRSSLINKRLAEDSQVQNILAEGAPSSGDLTHRHHQHPHSSSPPSQVVSKGGSEPMNQAKTDASVTSNDEISNIPDMQRASCKMGVCTQPLLQTDIEEIRSQTTQQNEAKAPHTAGCESIHQDTDGDMEMVMNGD